MAPGLLAAPLGEWGLRHVPHFKGTGGGRLTFTTRFTWTSEGCWPCPVQIPD